ncbi:hypothetical protein K3718_21415 (plasmid) [Leisingera aquaemixtae]|uniref:Uncharacterized protein n=1 Tax=Leisingera aquaemixtae TaxID=1396826 RepID=A0ABY5WRM8_9RHOB|nr:hypothetical protein [Leisingera aquaemixtae]UWQ44054.1 hypothetical protein K3718_21415 [Leisingera aquaemixtae]
MTSFTVTLYPDKGDWSHSVTFTWAEAARVVYALPGRSIDISADDTRMEIVSATQANWVVQRGDGTTKRWPISRKHMNEILTEELNNNTADDDDLEGS